MRHCKGLLAALCVAGGWLAISLAPALAEDTTAPAAAASGPAEADPAVIDAGRRVYRSKCVICHGRQGGRGPNLFRNPITDEKFVDTVAHGRKGTVMPAFAARLGADDIHAVLAFIRSRDALD